MSCQFTCNGCGKTIEPVYAFGRWQHPQGWFTKGAETDGKQSGLTACSEACAQKIDLDGPSFFAGKPGTQSTQGSKAKRRAA